MKKIFTILALFLATISFSFADKVDVEVARKVATNYISQTQFAAGSINLKLTQTYETTIISDFNPDIVETTPLLYIFNIGNDNGIVLVSGDDVATPILGYTNSGGFDNDNLPYNFKKWIEGYKSQIKYAIVNDIEVETSVEELWATLIAGENINQSNGDRTVNPLCTTTWNQSPYYNDLCPDNSVTGCVATAMAQVMKFWNHPAQGTGMHSYNHSSYGTLSANFGATTYDWGSMPNSISSSNNAIAVLNYQCGVSVDMNYSPNVSGAWVVEDDSPVCSESAFKNYFGYSSALHGEKRENFSTSQWTNMLRADLDAGIPIVYAGFGSGGGHCFVCDGYNDGDYFHFNWGWGGAYDGFFHIDALDPSGTGTGGGTGGFNSGHQAIFEMVPDVTTSTYDLQLYDNVIATPNPISLGQAFSVQTKVGNFGSSSFTGEFSAIIFDNNMNAIDNVEVVSGYIESGYFETISFSTSGLSTLLPGSYSISIFYRPAGEEWTQVGEGSYSNMIPFSVANESDIELYSSMNLSSGTTITAGIAFNVVVDIANYGGSTFYGSFDISLYDLEGYWIETIETMGGAALESMTYYDDLVFSTAGVSAAPGSYLVALQHKPDGGSWTLSGSSDYPNPIQVIIREPGETVDVYEPNDDENNAEGLSVNFSGNNASVYTTGSNSHNGSDYDFYDIYLPTGYDYQITARVHDSYNSGNGQSYTNDVLWSYNPGAFWSSAIDDVMFGDIMVYNGGSVKFFVAPYFLGETGTYLLDMQISRTPLGIDDNENSSIVKVYPVPVSNNLNLEVMNNAEINRIQVMDVSGKTVINLENPSNQSNNYSLPVDDLNSGTYVVIINTDDKVWHTKFIKK
ncbi:MAG: thiol protease/hemagglutinin PrtT [Bacteroidota bacterium]